VTLFGAAGTRLLERVVLSPAARVRVDSLLTLHDAFDREINAITKMISTRLRGHPGYAAVQTLPGIGPILGSVFVAEIGDVTRFGGSTQLASWAALTPRHH
jgi:transposase